MTPLKSRIADQILTDGPMSVSTYMAICLFDPDHGYYMSRNPLGRDGDFTTAPEVSQMFGELIGAWLLLLWRTLGKPQAPVFAEIGPGRGTLAKDIARTFDRLEPDLRGAASFKLIEVSPALMSTQAATLRDAGGGLDWIANVEELPDGRPLFIVGNELFDAIPARQFVKMPDGWRERCIGLTGAGEFCFVAGAASIDASLLPAGSPPAGTIFEAAPAREALMLQIADRIGRDGGAALFVDYGHVQPGFGDTLQAMRSHAYVDPLAEPGNADLTTHVDFAALAAAVATTGLQARLASQAEFLLSMGLVERAGRLGANADAATQARLTGEVQRLAGAEAMGDLFKVLAFSSSTGQLPGFERTP